MRNDDTERGGKHFTWAGVSECGASFFLPFLFTRDYYTRSPQLSYLFARERERESRRFEWRGDEDGRKEGMKDHVELDRVESIL